MSLNHESLLVRVHDRVDEVRPGAVTDGFNMSQWLIECQISGPP
jgi:hypothetical protein